MTLFSQRDSKWSNKFLGDSSTSTIGRYGCTLTCIAMATDTPPDVANDRLKAVQGFQNDLIYWPRVPLAFPELQFAARSQAYDNDTVKESIQRNGFSLVEVDFDGKIDSPLDMHWVVYTGNQRMLDPWTGVEKATSYYPLVKGYAVFNKTIPTVSPVIPDDQKRALDYLIANSKTGDNLEGIVRSWHGSYLAVPGLESKAKMLDGFISKWVEEWNLPAGSNLIEVEVEMAKLMILEDRIQEYRDSIEGCVGTFPSDSALLLAHTAVKKQIESLIGERDALQQKLNDAKVPAGYRFLKSWTILSLLWKLYKKI